jgi:hypothetical protein
VGGLNGNYMLAGGSGTEPTNTYGGGGIAGGNGGQLADDLEGGKVEKSTLDMLVDYFEPSFNLRDLIVSGCVAATFGTISILIGFSFAAVVVGGFLALPLVLIFMVIALIFVLIELIGVVIDPEGEFYIVNS